MYRKAPVTWEPGVRYDQQPSPSLHLYQLQDAQVNKWLPSWSCILQDPAEISDTMEQGWTDFLCPIRLSDSEKL